MIQYLKGRLSTPQSPQLSQPPTDPFPATHHTTHLRLAFAHRYASILPGLVRRCHALKSKGEAEAEAGTEGEKERTGEAAPCDQRQRALMPLHYDQRNLEAEVKRWLVSLI